MRIGKITTASYIFKGNESAIKTPAPASKPDASENKKININKSVIPIAVSVAIGAIVIGGILIKNKAPKTVITEPKINFSELYESAKITKKEAEGALEKSKGIFNTAKEKLSEIFDLIEEGRQKGFEEITAQGRKVEFEKTSLIDIEGRKTPSLINEFDSNGELLRKTELRNRGKISIKEFNPAEGTYNQYLYTDSFPVSFESGVKIGENGAQYTNERFDFEYGKNNFLEEYFKNLTLSKNEDSAEKYFKYSNNQITELFEGYKIPKEADCEMYSKKITCNNLSNIKSIALEGENDGRFNFAQELFEFDSYEKLKTAYTNSEFDDLTKKRTYEAKYIPDKNGNLISADE